MKQPKHPLPIWQKIRTLMIVGLVAILGMAVSSALKPALAQDYPINDVEITLELRRQLMESEIVSAHLIDIETEDGVVTLSGTVDHLLAKKQAQKIAESMKGVLEVKNQLIAQPIARPDSEIRQDVIEALSVDPATDTYEISVSVSQGEVTLKGIVDSMIEKRMAKTVAQGVKGVIGVTNNTEVRFKEVRLDSEIEKEIERVLELDPQIEESLIDVSVSNGEVTLSGTVDSLDEKRKVTTMAWTAGVNQVDNDDLTVDWETVALTIEEQPQVYRTDTEIRQDVEDALLYDPEVVSTEIDVSVDDGVVTLTGTVDNYNAQQAAEECAEIIEGVERVKNYINVRLETIPTDAEIADDVRNSLIRNPMVKSTEIDVSVVNQKVYLSGIVDRYVEKRQAEKAARRVNSVAAVENNISVNYQWSWKEDADIRTDIQDQFFWSPNVDGNDIVVTVNDGRALLTGTVASWSEHTAAIDNAFEGGAQTVVSYLEVINSPGSEDYKRTYDYPTFYDSYPLKAP